MKRNSMGDPQTFVDFLHAEYPDAFKDGDYHYLDHEVAYAHRDLLDRMREIHRVSGEYVAALSGDADTAWNAVLRIDSGAAASGPINTQYQAAVKSAARIMGLVSGFRSGLASRG